MTRSISLREMKARYPNKHRAKEKSKMSDNFDPKSPESVNPGQNSHAHHLHTNNLEGGMVEVVEVIEVVELIVICEFHEIHPHHPDCHHRKHIVDVVIDGKTVAVHRGEVPVAKLKKLGGVPLAFELDELVSGKLVALPDDGKVNIKGCEHFSGVPKDGSSS